MPTRPRPAAEPAELDVERAPDPDPARLRGQLLRWYDAHRRELPWRADPPDPYHVLLSEAMLQQTQVATVIPYFQRFLARWPTLVDLAAADEQDVLAMWQGLGYYRRARLLHRAAKAIAEDHGGSPPRDLAALQRLPGVGRYTAGAIASIAFSQPAPIVDGNVARVLARLTAMHQPIDQPAGSRRLWHLAERLVDPDRPGDFNQAMMELGATVCTPVSPRCLVCPIQHACLARRRGESDTLPVKAARTRVIAVTHQALLLRRRGRVLVRQRPDTGLWAGMWELPTWERHPEDAIAAAEAGATAAEELAAWAAQRLGLKPGGLALSLSFDHATTHRRIRFQRWDADAVEGRLRRSAARWVRPTELASLPLANPQRRLVRDLATAVE